MKVVHAAVSVAVDGLLDEVVEEVFDEGSVGTGGFDGEFGEILGTGDFDEVVFLGGVVAGGVDGLVLIVSSEAADGVVVFQAEADGVDDGMTGHAALVFGELGDFLPHGEVWVEIGVFEFDGLGWRFEKSSQDIAAEVNATVNRGGLFVVGEGGEDVGMGQESGGV